MWDRESLVDIIGDFHATLSECRQLLEDNKKYSGPPSGPMDSLKWHVFVQPSADRLKHRLQLQNARIQAVLKPFEMCVGLCVGAACPPSLPTSVLCSG